MRAIRGCQMQGLEINQATGMPVAWLHEAIRDSWSADTSSDPGWSAGNPALGQCAVTSLLLQAALGGELAWARAVPPGGDPVSHYWNLLPGGIEEDRTRCQFPEGTQVPSPQPKEFSGFADLRAYVLSFEPTRRRYLALLDGVASRLRHVKAMSRLQDERRSSQDGDTQVSCIVATRCGSTVPHANRFPPGVRTDVPGRTERPGKYMFIEHAERAAINYCARQGIATEGATIYMRGRPCADCARAIISSGIVRMVTADIRVDGQWIAQQDAGFEMLCESGIVVELTWLPSDLASALRASVDIVGVSASPRTD